MNQSKMKNRNEITIVGAGFTGLTLGIYLIKKNYRVKILESSSEIGGLASTFKLEKGQELEKFYHHWFNNDIHILNLIKELNLEENIKVNFSKTGLYYANNFFKLSSPLDLLRFKPLNLIQRIRLGLLALRVKFISNWMLLEKKSAEDWLIELGGKRVFEIVWKPLLEGKFGSYSKEISAVWFWNKLKLRGGSRGEKGKEELLFYKGGFKELINSMAKEIKNKGGHIQLEYPVKKIEQIGNLWLLNEEIQTDKIIITTAIPIYKKLIEPWADKNYLRGLNKIKYIGNVCLILELSKSLSDTYWLNVNDSSFPFVGLIEHTNFEQKENYNGNHIVYLSKYIQTASTLYNLTKEEFFDYSIPFIQKMFPEFEENWVVNYHLWKAEYSQPIVTKEYSNIKPEMKTPYDGLFLCSMAQIYPEDRGTNYAVKYAKKLVNDFF